MVRSNKSIKILFSTKILKNTLLHPLFCEIHNRLNLNYSKPSTRKSEFSPKMNSLLAREILIQISVAMKETMCLKSKRMNNESWWDQPIKIKASKKDLQNTLSFALLVIKPWDNPSRQNKFLILTILNLMMKEENCRFFKVDLTLFLKPKVIRTQIFHRNSKNKIQ